MGRNGTASEAEKMKEIYIDTLPSIFEAMTTMQKFKKAKAYCDDPFEVKHQGRKKKNIPIIGEWIGDHLNGDSSTPPRVVNLACQDAASCTLPDASLDAVFTDPPYFGNVQYAELMDFCYVWLKKMIKNNADAFAADSTRSPEELTGLPVGHSGGLRRRVKPRRNEQDQERCNIGKHS